jgi:3-oxoacyl-[acyl-carrier-protein] synthase III
MFIKVSNLNSGIPVSIAGLGHTDLVDDPRLQLIDQKGFIEKCMTDEGRTNLFKHPPPFSQPEIKLAVEKWENQTGIIQREFFSGTVPELGLTAAKKCLKNANVDPHKLDAIIGVSNTGPGYPSLADHIKKGLSNWVDKLTGGPETMCWDVTEACTAGTIGIFNAWNLIRSGSAECVLVVWAEKATELASWNDWRSANLFGDAASAMLLKKSSNTEESFLFWDIASLPYAGGIRAIIKTIRGFAQEGPKVHKFVGRVVSRMVIDSIKKAQIDPSKIKFIVPHQPSVKTLELLKTNIQKGIPDFKETFCIDVKDIGNVSSVSTGRILSKLAAKGELKRGQIIISFSFGAGLSVAITGFIY